MIIRADLRPVRLTYRQPVRLRDRVLSHRDGFLLRIEDSLGRSGYGEALAWTDDELLALHRALEALCQQVGAASSKGELPALPAAAAFAFDTARCDLESQACGLPRRKLLNLAAGTATMVNGLLAHDDADALARALDMAAERGLRTLKIKLGRADFEDDMRAVAAVRRRLPDVELRGDANGAWSEPQALERLAALAPFRFSYIEEPVAGYDALVRLACAAAIRPAVDESLAGTEACESTLVRVLKPVRLGAFAHTRTAIARAHDAVITGAFDGPIATLMAAEMAAAWLPASTAQGLDVAALYESPLDYRGDVLRLDTRFSHLTSSYGPSTVSA